MKIKDIVEKTKEYNRIQNLIDNIETNLKDFDKTGTSDGGIYYVGGILSSYGRIEKGIVDITINSEVRELIQDDMKALFKKHLKALKVEQEALEL